MFRDILDVQPLFEEMPRGTRRDLLVVASWWQEPHRRIEATRLPGTGTLPVSTRTSVMTGWRSSSCGTAGICEALLDDVASGTPPVW